MKAPINPQSYCYDEIAKELHSRAVRRFYRAALKALPGFTPVGPVNFNRGGIAVWGEVTITLQSHGGRMVEAYNTTMGILIRQTDGHNSGHNRYAKTLEQFVQIAQEECAKPFVRF